MSSPYALIVEDEGGVAQIFQQALQDAGYETEVLASAHEAQARLVFSAPDLILLDLHLPRLSGEVLLRQLRGQPRLSKVPVVVVTGDVEAAERLAYDVETVLVKPVGYEQVHRLAKDLLPTQV